MKNLFKRYRSSRELKRWVKENAVQGKPLSVMNDIVFKAMLTSDSEDSREALRHLLSACTRREVSGVQVKNSELLPAHLDAKTTRFDVHVTFNDGESADLEMQLCKPADDLKTRAVMYTTMLMSGQSRRGYNYREIKRVYQIFFLNFTLFPNSDKLPRRYFYMEEEEHDRLTNATEIIFYEMPKLEQKVQDILAGKADMETLSGEEKWCMFMKYRHEDRAGKLIEELSLKEEGIMRAERAVAKIDRDYEKFARKMAEMKNSMDAASKIYDLRQKAIAEVGDEVRTMEKLEIARKMKGMGDTTEKIQAITDLPAETIERL
jgi:predicted transposase/invertase (TIGR01784 family)